MDISHLSGILASVKLLITENNVPMILIQVELYMLWKTQYKISV